ncbi:MAG: 4a-hydroxytetrahydrobiopterin dehydratase [Phycisphaerae bacterium]|nr:4a-hydroxytetrahydrobiopterin dehydratase [Phycisphaerae bacterium]
MENLQDIKCAACQGGASLVTQEEITQFMPNLAEWNIKQVFEINRLERTYYFKDFKEALAFTQRVGDLAEQANHHPAILTEWGRVTVSWWTHKIKGLHINDFVMALQTDNLLQGALQ